MKNILFLALMIISQSAFCWILKGQDGKCTDGGESFSPDGFLSSSMAECTKLSETKFKTELSCKSRVVAMNGKISFYGSMDDCSKDGGTHSTNKSQNIKDKWKKNYASKLWSLHKMTCPKPTDLDCSKSAITIKEFIQNITPVYEGKGYKCTNTFNVVLSTETPPDNFKMSFICMRPSDLCTSSVFWFETEKECKEFRKESK